MKRLICFVAMLIIFFGCVQPPPEPSAHKDVVEYGDEVAVEYAVWINRTTDSAANETLRPILVDTNVIGIAQNESIYTPNTNKYKPLKFTALIGEGMIDGFVNGVVGMEINETKEFVIHPEDGYGQPDPSLRYEIRRYYEKDMVETVPFEFLTSKGISIEEGLPLETDVGTVFISEVDNATRTVNITYLFEIGSIFYYNGIPQQVVGSSGEKYTILVDVLEGGRYQILSPLSGNEVLVTAVNITNTTIVFDENHPLAGKDLYYRVKVVELWKSSNIPNS